MAATATEHTQCLVCEGKSLKALPKYALHRLVKCRSCGFVFAGKIPTTEELVAHYETYERANAISPITVKRYHELLDGFEPFRVSNRIIDVGCGDGYFLQVAQERGWEVYGTEFTDEAISVCTAKGISMQQGKLDPAHYPDGFFDVVTSFEVVEHINNPREELAHMATILRKDGLIYMTTPNFNSVSRYLLGPKWSIITYPEHLCYYTPKTLSRALRNAGFSRKHITTSGISVRRFSAGISSTQTATVDEEALREKTETKAVYRFAKKTINAFLHFTGLGDTLKVSFILRKP